MANRTVTNLTAVLQMNNTKFKKGLKGSQRAMTGFQKQMASLKSTIAATFAITAIIRFTKSSFEALDTQRKAEAALLTALKGKTNVQQELIEQAQQLQKLTLFGDEETIMAQSMIAAFVRSGETLKQVTPLVQDMATALQMNLVGAASLVAKTLGSSTNALTRYGITVTGAVGSTERLTSLVDGLSMAFKGQAEAAAAADMTLTQLQNRIGDVKEGLASGLGKALVFVADAFNAKFNPELFLAHQAAAVLAEALQDVNTSLKGDEMTNRINMMRNLNIETELAAEAQRKLMATIKTPDSVGGLTAGEDRFFGGLDTGLTWDVEPVLDGMKELNSVMSSMDDIIESWEDDWDEVFGEETANKVSKISTESMKLGELVGVMMVQQFDALGEAIAKSLGGAEGALNDLGEAILANLGNILIMAGLQSGNIGLIIAGAGLQLGSGLIRGFGDTTPDVAVGSTSGSGNVNFTISGRNLTGVLERNNSYKNQVT